MRVFLPLTIAFLVAVFIYAEVTKEPTCEVWTYHTRPGEEASRAYVCLVEDHERFGRIYHLYVDGLEIDNPKAKGEADAKIPVLAHVPVTEAAFRRSVIDRVRDDAPIPPYEKGYERWQREGGSAFDKPLSELVTIMASAIQTNR